MENAAHGVPRIVGAVIQSGRIFRAGDEAELAVAMAGQSYDRLVAAGAVIGDWIVPVPTAEHPDAAPRAKVSIARKAGRHRKASAAPADPSSPDTEAT